MNVNTSIQRISWWASRSIPNFQSPPHAPVQSRPSPSQPFPNHPRSAPLVIKWMHPSPGWFKLNVDGSARDYPGFSGGGGICRSDDGSFKFAFSAGYGVGSNNLAELRAVHEGMLFCLAKGINQTFVESDSKLMTDILLGVTPCPWKWRPWATRINLLRRLRNFSFKRIFHEGNGPVDALAKIGSESQENSLHDHFDSLPRLVKDLIFLDKVGLGSIRALP